MFGKYQNGKYENWHNSRWQYTCENSNYDFDKSRASDNQPELITQFSGYWNLELETALKRCVPVTWSTRHLAFKDKYDKKEKPYSVYAEEFDLFRAGANTKMELYDVAPVDDLPLFNKMAKSLDLDPATIDIKFHCQRLGQMMNMHIVKMVSRHERGNSFKITKIDKDPDIAKRYIIMLDDWDYGQLITFGNDTLTHWKSGDCYTWDWHNIPISSANTGWTPRPLLQVTGFVIDKKIPKTIDL